MSKDGDLVGEYNTILDKVSAAIKKELHSKPVYNKIKPYDDKVTNFYDKEILKVISNHTCLAVISLDSALKKDKNYYPQVFLKDCKYN